MADTRKYSFTNGWLNPWLVLLLIDLVQAGEYCVHYIKGIRYCKYGCCGSTFKQYCCLLATWIIVLIVLIGLGIIFVVAVVFVCFYCKKRQRTRGTVMPASNPTTTVVSNVQSYPQYGYPPPGQPPPPYPYPQGGFVYGNTGGQAGAPGQQNSNSYPYTNPSAPPQQNSDYIGQPVTGAQLDPAYPPPGIYDTQYTNQK